MESFGDVRTILNVNLLKKDRTVSKDKLNVFAKQIKKE